MLYDDGSPPRRSREKGGCFLSCIAPNNDDDNFLQEKYYEIDTNERAPEVKAGFVSSEPCVAIAISGGGFRSFACACGQMRALRDAGLWNEISYMSASSGGAWFALAFHCADGDDDILLGPICSPDKLKLAKLGQDAAQPGCLRKAATVAIGPECNQRFLRHAIKAPGRAVLSALEEVLEENLFEPYRKVKANDSQGFSDALSVKKKPFILVGVALLGPWSAVPFPERQRQYRCLEISPLAAGSPLLCNVHFKKNVSRDIGGFVDTRNFGKDQDQDCYVLQRKRHLIKNSNNVGLIAALCGCAHADFVCSHQAPRDLAQVFARQLTTPLLPYKNENFVVGDGGIIDNLNLIPLIRRDNVQTIICFCNFETPLNDAWDPFLRPAPQYENGSCLDIDASLASYFGYNVIPDSDRIGYFLARNHCFQADAFPTLIHRLQLAQRSGQGAVAAVDVTTVRNDWAAVQAGRSKRLIVIYLGRCSQWEAMLADSDLKRILIPPKLSDTTHIDSTKLVENQSRFDHFPHMAASGPFAPSFDLASVDLLANFAGWVVKQNAPRIRDLIYHNIHPSFDILSPRTISDDELYGDNKTKKENTLPQGTPVLVAPDPAHTIQPIRKNRAPRRVASVTRLARLDGALDALADGR